LVGITRDCFIPFRQDGTYDNGRRDATPAFCIRHAWLAAGYSFPIEHSHCERSEAIQAVEKYAKKGCFVI